MNLYLLIYHLCNNNNNNTLNNPNEELQSGAMWELNLKCHLKHSFRINYNYNNS